jgi:hypothetical protein
VLIKDKPLISRLGHSSESVHSIAFKATLVGHSFVLLENFRVLRVCPDTLGRITKFSKHEPN